MEHNQHSSLAPAPTGPGVSSLQLGAPDDAPDDAGTTALVDAHGHDPAAYDWVPVRRKARADGWSPEKQRLFIAALADTGSVTRAGREVGMSARSAYALRRAPDAAGFDRAWRVAIRHAMARLIDVCMERALDGSEEAILDKEGRCLGFRTRHHDRLAMFLLRAHMPELFRDAHRADRARGEALPAPPEPVADALALLDPVPPADPAALLPPDRLAAALDTADILDGKLPRWHRDPDLVAREAQALADAAGNRGDPYNRGNSYDPDSPDDPDGRYVSPLGEQFERDLEAAKAGTYRAPRPRRPSKSRPSKPPAGCDDDDA